MKKLKELVFKFFFYVKKFCNFLGISIMVGKVQLIITDYSTETIRYLIGFVSTLYKNYLNKVIIFRWFIKLQKKITGILFFFFIRYVMTFFFLGWIVIESFFFRFYLVDTPQDSRVPKDRRELSSKWWYRYLPLMIIESNLFYPRPAWRLFTTFSIFVANLRAVFIVFYIIYIEDLFKFFLNLGYLFFKFIYFFLILLSNLFTFFIKSGLMFIVDLLFYFIRLRILPFLRSSFTMYIYICNLPIVLMGQFVRVILLTVPKIYFFFFVFNWIEFFFFFKYMKKKKLEQNKKWVYSSLNNFVFNKIIFNFYLFAYYMDKKGKIIDYHPWFFFNIYMDSLLNFVYFYFYLFFLCLKVMYYILFGFMNYIFFFALFHPFFF